MYKTHLEWIKPVAGLAVVDPRALNVLGSCQKQTHTHARNARVSKHRHRHMDTRTRMYSTSSSSSSSSSSHRCARQTWTPLESQSTTRPRGPGARPCTWQGDHAVQSGCSQPRPAGQTCQTPGTRSSSAGMVCFLRLCLCLVCAGASGRSQKHM